MVQCGEFVCCVCEYEDGDWVDVVGQGFCVCCVGGVVDGDCGVQLCECFCYGVGGCGVVDEVEDCCVGWGDCCVCEQQYCGECEYVVCGGQCEVFGVECQQQWCEWGVVV